MSNADREVEQAIRGRLAFERPGDVIDGEEFGGGGEGNRRWVIDPVDGTRNYVRGIPVFATLLALVEDGRPVVGVVSAPAMGARWWAARGEGAHSAGGSLAVSAVRHLEDATVGHGHLDAFRQAGCLEAFIALCEQVYQPRGLGDFWQHMLVASGLMDACVDPIAHPWDVAAIQVIVEEAGGRFTDLAGNHGFLGGNAVSSNGQPGVHDEVLRLMANGPRTPPAAPV